MTPYLHFQNSQYCSENSESSEHIDGYVRIGYTLISSIVHNYASCIICWLAQKPQQ